MSVRLRKIFKLGSSSYPMPTTIMASTKTQVYNIASPQIPTLNTRLVKYFCTDQTNADSSKPDGSDNKLEFLKWDNGGGSFHESAVIHRTAVVEFGAVVHSAALVGENAIIASGTIVGPAVEIGQSTRLGYNVSLANCTIGDNCIIHNGVCIGQDGFGFYMDEEGNMVKKPQLLKVKIGNHVEIGANTCIDRGSWRNTIIGDHTKIDNLVQIGHNVQIGNKCLICGQVGIAGSVTIGDCVTMGGRVAIRDHVCIASKVRLAANSLVTKDINEPGDFGGFPAMPIGKWRRLVAAQHRSLK